MKKLVSIVLALALVLLCVGAASAATITLTNATQGQAYNAYKIFSASPSDPDDLDAGVSYTATAAQVEITGFTDVFDTFEDQSGNYTISKKSGVQDAAVISFIKENFDALKQGNAIAGVFSGNTVTFTTPDAGYYYITSGLGALVTIDTVGSSVSVVDKNESTPEGPDKVITAEDSAINEGQDQSGLSVETNDASVATVESFKVEFSAVNYVQSNDTTATGDGNKVLVTEYNFVDTPRNLSIDANSVRVYANYGTSAQQEITSTITGKAINETTGALTFTIPWASNGASLYATQTAGSELIPVAVTYNATVLASAATATAPNTVEVHYNNNPDLSLGTDSTTTYTYKFKLLKVDENQDPLTGAEFELYYGSTANEDATALTFTMDNGAYRFDPAGTVTHIAPTGANAEALIIGLDNADYMIREVVAPAGYNKAADTAVNGLSRVDVTETETTHIEHTIIQDLKGTELPSTGGIGTTIFYIVGGLLVIGAAVILVARRKSHE